MESLSAYARQFLEQMEKPDVDLIDGLSPAISIEQKTTGSNPRSTVGTVTEIYDYLRLLFANIGVPHCPSCGKEIASQSLERIADMVMLYPQDSRINVLAPLVRGRKGEFKKELAGLRTRGFTKTDGAADLYVHYYVLATVQTSSQYMGQFLAPIPEWGVPPFAPITTAVEIFPFGTLLIDITSPAKKAIVWRGSAARKIDVERPDEERRKVLDQAIRDLLKKFPPKK